MVTSATNLQADGNAAFQTDMATLLGNLVGNFSSNEKTQYRALMPHTPIVSDYALGGHGVPADPVVYQNYCGNVDALAASGFDPASTNSGGVGPQGISPFQYINDYCGDKPSLFWAGLPAVADSVMNIKGCNTTVASSGLFAANTQALRAAGYGSWITQLGVKGTYTGTNTFTGINTWQFADNYSECGDAYDGGNWGMVSAEDNPYDGVHDTTGTTPEYIGNNAFTPTPELHNYGDMIDPVRIDIVNQENSLLGSSPSLPIVPTGRQPMLTLGHARKKRWDGSSCRRQPVNFFHAHPFALVFSWWVFSAATGSLPAPTAQSSPFYQWSFKFLNTIAANIARAYNTSVENSPNFLPAVDMHLGRQAAPNPADGKT